MSVRIVFFFFFFFFQNDLPWRPSPAPLRRLGASGRSRTPRGSRRERSSSCCSSSPPTRKPWRRRVDSASLSDRRSRRRKRNTLQLLRATLLLRRQLVPPMAHQRHPARCLVVRDAVLRAARNTSHGQTHNRKRLHMQPLQWAMRRLLRSELLDLRRCERTMLLRVRTRGSAAVLRAARSATRRARSPSAQPQAHCSTSSGCAGSLRCGAGSASRTRT